MHFEVPKAHTIKEFSGEYLMIVVSIMTALALEHGAHTLYKKSVAAQASERIEAEIHANIAEISKVLAHNRGEVVKLTALRKDLLTNIQSGMEDATLMEQLTKDFKRDFRLSMKSPALRREAWDVAVANQSVSYMPTRSLTRYSVVYANMRDVQSIATGGGNNFLDAPHTIDVMSNIQMGVSNPQEVFRMLGQVISAHGGINGNLEGLRDELRSASVPVAGKP